jgi:hypothetical protein
MENKALCFLLFLPWIVLRTGKETAETEQEEALEEKEEAAVSQSIRELPSRWRERAWCCASLRTEALTVVRYRRASSNGVADELGTASAVDSASAARRRPE